MLVKSDLEYRFVFALCLASFLGLATGCNNGASSSNPQGETKSEEQSNQQRGQQFVSAEIIPESAKKLKMIMLAIQNHHDTQKRFPAAYSIDSKGKRLLSWRVHILPYLEQGELYDEFHLDEPWDSDHNKKLIERMPDVFRATNSLAEKGKTIFRGFGGIGGMFRRPSQNSHLGGRMTQVLDGTANTAMIVETTDALAIEWTRPGILPHVEEFDFSKLFGRYSGGTNFAFVDGSVKFISDAIMPNQLICYFTRNDGCPVKNFPRMIELQELERQSDPEAFAQKVQKEVSQLKEIFKLSSAAEKTFDYNLIFELEQKFQEELFNKILTEEIIQGYAR